MCNHGNRFVLVYDAALLHVFELLLQSIFYRLLYIFLALVDVVRVPLWWWSICWCGSGCGLSVDWRQPKPTVERDFTLIERERAMGRECIPLTTTTTIYNDRNKKKKYEWNSMCMINISFVYLAVWQIRTTLKLSAITAAAAWCKKYVVYWFWGRKTALAGWLVGGGGRPQQQSDR